MNVLQEWVVELPLMQQSVLLSAIRGCDGIAKKHPAKSLVKWYRRCVLLSAFDGRALTDPFEPGGGSFTGPIGPSEPPVDHTGDYIFPVEDWRQKQLHKAVDDFVRSRDELPFHYTGHMMHAFEIVGYKHPDLNIRTFWYMVYVQLVTALHLWPEPVEQMDRRLGDNEKHWREADMFGQEQS